MIIVKKVQHNLAWFFFSDTVISQLNSSINMHMGILRCCSKSSYVQKTLKYDTKFAELSWKFLPLAVAWGPEG